MYKTGESANNAFRRFLIANSHKSSTKLRSLLLENIAHLDFDMQERLRNVDLFEIYNTDFRNRLGLEKLSYSPLDTTEYIRNCRQCAQSIYHSSVYQYPWLTHCPIHGDPLTHKCSGCGKRWPRASELYQSKCATCGVFYSFTELAMRGALSQPKKTSLIVQLEAFIQKVKAAYSNGNLTTGDGRYCNSSYTRGWIGPRSLFFPSVTAKLFPGSAMLFEKLGVRVRESLCLAGSLGETAIDVFDNGKPMYPAWRSRVIDRAALKIELAISRDAGSCLLAYKASDDVSHALSCPYCTAYRIWISLVSAPRESRYKLSYIYGYDYFRSYCGHLMAPIPAPMRFHSASQDNAYISDRVYRHVPDALQRILYYVDLWTTFISVFHFVDQAFRFGHRPEINRLAQLPNISSGANSISRSIGFVHKEDRKLCVAIPKELLRTELRNLPFLDSW